MNFPSMTESEAKNLAKDWVKNTNDYSDKGIRWKDLAIKKGFKENI